MTLPAVNESEETWRYVFKRVFDLAEIVFRSVLSPTMVLGLTGLLTVAVCFALYTGAGSAQEMIAVAREGSELAKNGAVSVLGWIVAVAELVFFAPVAYFGYRMNKSQGAELGKYRDERDPHRASSTRPDALVARARMTPEQLMTEAKGAD